LCAYLLDYGALFFDKSPKYNPDINLSLFIIVVVILLELFFLCFWYSFSTYFWKFSLDYSFLLVILSFLLDNIKLLYVLGSLLIPYSYDMPNNCKCLLRSGIFKEFTFFYLSFLFLWYAKHMSLYSCVESNNFLQESSYEIGFFTIWSAISLFSV